MNNFLQISGIDPMRPLICFLKPHNEKGVLNDFYVFYPFCRLPALRIIPTEYTRPSEAGFHRSM